MAAVTSCENRELDKKTVILYHLPHKGQSDGFLFFFDWHMHALAIEHMESSSC